MEHLIRLWTAIRVSIAGFRTAWNSDITIRQWTIFAILNTICALVFAQTGLECALLIAVGVQVLLIELLNTSIEAAIDRIGPERNPYSKAAKDIGSMAVFLAFLLCMAVWAVIFLFGG